MSNLITEHNQNSNPENTVRRVEVPRIIASTPRATVLDSGANPQQERINQILAPVLNPLETTPSTLPSLTQTQFGDFAGQAADNMAQQAGSYFNWQLNNLRNLPTQFHSPLYRDSYGLNQQSFAPLGLAMPRQEDPSQAAMLYREQYGPDAPNPMRNAWRQNNNMVGREPGPGPRRSDIRTGFGIRAPQWLRRAVEVGSGLALRPVDLAVGIAEGITGRDLPQPSQVAARALVSATESTVANTAALGGGFLQLGYVVADAVQTYQGALFDQSFGRLFFGTPAASAARRAEDRERIGTPIRDYLQPAMDLYDEFVPPEGNATAGNILQGDFGSYGRGLPGALNWSQDYIGSVLLGTGLSLWRGGRTIEHALRGEDYDYDWDQPLWQALNPLDNSETYSFLESPEYSPLSIQRFMAQGEDLSWAQRASNIGLLATGFLLDSRTPDIADFLRLNRVMRAASGVGDSTALVRQTPPSTPGGPRLIGPQDGLPPGPEPSGLLPPSDRPPAPGPGTTPSPAVPPGGEPMPPLSGAAEAQPEYYLLFELEDGTGVELPRDIMQTVDSFILSERTEAIDTISRQQTWGTRYAPNQLNQIERQENVLNQRQRRQDRIFDAPSGVNPREEAEDLLSRALEQPFAERPLEGPVTRGEEVTSEPTPESVPFVEELPRRPGVDDNIALGNEIPDPWEAPTTRTTDTPEDIRRAAPDPEVIPDQRMLPAGEETPMRFSAEAEVQRAIDDGELRATPSGAFVKATDSIEDSRWRLISNRQEHRRLREIPDESRTPVMRRRLLELDQEFPKLRDAVAGRPVKPIDNLPRPTPESRLDEVLPVVKQGSLVPPKNPAQLYQWSRNLPADQSIYVPDAELVDRTAKQLTDLARFFGHADVPRGTVLSGEQLQDLRMTYGSIYNTVGPQLDSKALKTLSVEGVARVETKRANPVKSEPQETKLVSNENMRDPERRTATPETFNSPSKYSQTELSLLSDESLEIELNGRFSPEEIYKNGLPNRELADTRNDLLQEQAYRAGWDVNDALEFFPEDLEKYAEMNGIRVEDLSDTEYLDFARQATEDAAIRSSLDVSAVNQSLPDSMQSPTLSPEAVEAIEELVIAERGVERAMVEVRHRVDLLEELESEMRAPSKALSDSVLQGDNLLPNNLSVGTHDNVRQQRVDKIADRASAERDRITRRSTPNFEVVSSRESQPPGTIFYDDPEATPEQKAWMEYGGQNYIPPTVATRSEIDKTFPNVTEAAANAREYGYQGVDDYEVLARYMAGGASRQVASQNIYPVYFTDDKLTTQAPRGRASREGVTTQIITAPSSRQGTRRRQLREGLSWSMVPIDEVFANHEASGLRIDLTDPGERARVDSFKQSIQNGEPIAPMRLGFFTPEKAEEYGTDPGWSVTDGRHRLQAYKELGIAEVEALVDGLPERAPVWYHGTRDNVASLADIDSYQTGTTRRPLGAGTYFYNNSKTAQAAAGEFAPVNSVGHYPKTPQGTVFSATLEDANLLDGAALVNVDPKVWSGIRNLIKEAFGEDKKGATNAINAARKKNIPQMFDYIASKFQIGDAGGVDEVKIFELQTRISNFLLAQGYDGIKFDSSAGSVVNLFDTRSPRMVPGATTQVGGPRAIEQSVESVNRTRAEAGIFGTESARQAAEQASLRFGKELRRQLVKRLQEASEMVDNAFRRYMEADDAVTEIAQRDQELMKRIEAKEDAERMKTFIKDNEQPPCL